MKKKKTLLIPLLLIPILLLTTLILLPEEPEPFTSPLYFTFVIHTEEDINKYGVEKENNMDYDGDEELLLHATMTMRELAEIAQNHGVKINFGTDWTFANGVELYDPTFFTDLESMGHEIDAHAHESHILYSEVREDIISAGGTPTQIASGLTEDEIYEKMEYFDTYYPDFTTLWGVSLAGHELGEVIAGNVWRPSREDWTQHDKNGDYIYIGHGEYANSINYIENAINNRKENQINTYAVFTNPRHFKASKASTIDDKWTAKESSYEYYETRLEWWDNFFTELDTYVESGKVEYVTLTEISEIFIEQENQLIFTDEEIPRSEEALTSLNEQEGYKL
ncbi:hypothetical protein HOD38_05370 [archaeon]|jgi:hypothetical protein|nr:hypothetical protein [archaeon]MBT4397670.1 hypothetical protein [archaeon]MBT4441634.1 hypothetical protein [archaeon]